MGGVRACNEKIGEPGDEAMCRCTIDLGYQYIPSAGVGYTLLNIHSCVMEGAGHETISMT